MSKYDISGDQCEQLLARELDDSFVDYQNYLPAKGWATVLLENDEVDPALSSLVLLAKEQGELTREAINDVITNFANGGATMAEIQSFAELEHHFDRPIRTYSSGMKSRLGISVATAFKPDLLLIDEVLGVGDVSFRKKSEQRVKDLIEQSGSVVIVSHSMGLLQAICSRMILIDAGRIIEIGLPTKVLKEYSKQIKV